MSENPILAHLLGLPSLANVYGVLLHPRRSKPGAVLGFVVCYADGSQSKPQSLRTRDIRQARAGIREALEHFEQWREQEAEPEDGNPLSQAGANSSPARSVQGRP